MFFQRFKKILFFLIILIVFDYLLTLFIISKFKFYEYYYPKQEHRITNSIYHHSFKANINAIDTWGSKKYKFITNSLGFKDKSNRNIDPQSNFKKRIIIDGDSFTEGIGFAYEDTFVGILDDKLSKENIEILNAAVASHSPKLYLNKIKYITKEKNINFDELIIFLDISDIPNDNYYHNNYNDIFDDSLDLRDSLQIFFVENFSTYLFFDIIFYYLDCFKEKLINRFNASVFFNMNFFSIKNEEVNIYNALFVKKGNWIHDNIYWEKHGKIGRDIASDNLVKISNVSKANNIDFTLVIYPWPNQIYFNDNHDRHREYWKTWSLKNGVNFIDLYKYFDTMEPKKTIKKYFIPGDVQWNKKGHEYIYNLLLKEYFN